MLPGLCTLLCREQNSCGPEHGEMEQHPPHRLVLGQLGEGTESLSFLGLHLVGAQEGSMPRPAPVPTGRQ